MNNSSATKKPLELVRDDLCLKIFLTFSGNATGV